LMGAFRIEATRLPLGQNATACCRMCWLPLITASA
jgi:hypothetical protein